MKIKWFILILAAATCLGYSRDEYLLRFNKGVEDLGFLSQIEKNVIIELNKARTNPARYAESLVEFKRFYLGKYIKIPGKENIITEEGSAAVNEAVEFLESTDPVPPLAVSKGITLAAKSHVNDQGSTGLVSHRGTDNSSPLDRMLRFGKVNGAWGENIGYGDETAREVVMQLIIDDGVYDRGHRNKIFSREFAVVGVGYGVHSSYGTMCVINFSAAYEEKNTRD